MVNQVSNEKEDGHSLQHAAGCVQESEKVPMIKAVIIARKRINDFLRISALTVTF